MAIILRIWPIVVRTAVATVTAAIIVVGQSRPAIVNGAEGDGVVQPGDRTAPGRCSAGPVVDGVVFTAAHCTVDAIDGRPLQQLGSWPDPDETEPPGLDAQWFTTESDITNTITTGEGDIDVAGVLRPWPGMHIDKTGWVSGTTSGIAFDAPDPLLAGTWVRGLKVCHGDSGSVAYARVGPSDEVYIVGMVTNGNGGTNRETGEEEPNGTCSEAPPLDGDGRPDYWATIRRVDAMCDAAGLMDCVDEAGRVFGAIRSVNGTESGANIDVWAFDASDILRPAQVLATVDGVETQEFATSHPSIRTILDYRLSATARPLARVELDLEPGAHDVCIVVVNQDRGTDLDLGCRSVRAGQRFPGLAGGPPLGTDGEFLEWWRQPDRPI